MGAVSTSARSALAGLRARPHHATVWLTAPPPAAVRALTVAVIAIGLVTVSSAWSDPAPATGGAAAGGSPALAGAGTGETFGSGSGASGWTDTSAPSSSPTAPTGSSVVPSATVVPVLQSAPPTSVPTGIALPSGAVSQLAADGIPATALAAYQAAASRANVLHPGCGIPWALLAGIGRVESDHGRYGDSQLYANGESAPPVIGIPLNGIGTARIMDTDHGRLDGDPVFDRAVGPMQFIPSTWAVYGVDGNGDGRVDPFNIFDAAAAAADYLCTAGGDLGTLTGQTAAVLAYNQSTEYLSSVLALEGIYAGGGISEPSAPGPTPPYYANPTYVPPPASPPPLDQPAGGPMPPVNPGPPLSPPKHNPPPSAPPTPHSTAPGSTAPGSTAPPSSAPGSTAAPSPSASVPPPTATSCPVGTSTVTVTVTAGTPTVTVTVTATDSTTPATGVPTPPTAGSAPGTGVGTAGPTVTVTVTAFPPAGSSTPPTTAVSTPASGAVDPSTPAGSATPTVAPSPSC